MIFYENSVQECLFVQAQVILPGAINAPSELDRSVLLDNIKVNFQIREMGKDDKFVSCAHKYKKGCDVDGRKMQPWMLIAIVGVLLVLGTSSIFFVDFIYFLRKINFTDE